MLSHKKIFQLPVIYNFIHFKLKVDKWKSIIEDGKLVFYTFVRLIIVQLIYIKIITLIKLPMSIKKMLIKLFKIYKKCVRVIDKLIY